ncbi:MAG: 16S rRNA (guanine(966)-N(2))-methyltransferase RsmD [Acholeplasmatales bacterium]|nr:16S rRNA (guanine(966)-N(2))-methyltransferase RsmD [Acholeplasmatales bacterium]
MRIIGGKLRHRIIDMTNLETTRETQDKVRGAIFNMIGPYLEGDYCLDLFAGSGAMGVEAYSRGISNVVFNDINNKALDVCKSNCKKLGINDALFYNKDYLDFLNNDNHVYDLIILDPPYKMNNIDEIITPCLDKIKKGGRIVFEMGKETIFKDSYLDLILIKNKEYGIKRVVVYEKK